MKHQTIRKLILIISLLLFPVTLYYFSPALIITAALEGIINGSFIVFVLLFVASLFLGRIFCAYLCPAGGLQECLLAAQGKPTQRSWKYRIKYFIWAVWILAIVVCYVHSGGVRGIDFYYETEHGISVMQPQAYIIYYGILLLIVVPALTAGKRGFCHYFCWMAPFMVLGAKLGRFLHLPQLHIAAKKDACIACKQCNKACPMSIDVQRPVPQGHIGDVECIQCGACIDSCPKKVLSYKMKQE